MEMEISLVKTSLFADFKESHAAIAVLVVGKFKTCVANDSASCCLTDRNALVNKLMRV